MILVKLTSTQSGVVIEDLALSDNHIITGDMASNRYPDTLLREDYLELLRYDGRYLASTTRGCVLTLEYAEESPL